MSTASPEWKKPSDTMKVMRKKRSSTKSPAISAADRLRTSVRKSPQRTKRKNPFGCSPRKKINMKFEDCNVDSVRETVNDAAADGTLMDILNKNDNDIIKKTILTPTCVPMLAEASKTPLVDRSSRKSAEKVAEHSSHYPKDWCLRMKTRYVSSTPFTWCSPLKTVDEARGMEHFVQNTPPLTDLQGKLPGQCGDAKAEFHRCCLYWIHPNIPWLKLFPRLITDNKIGKTSAVLQNKEVLDSLMTDWTESYTSIFHLLRARLCPYFYMCCHQFTVAFFAAQTRSDQIEAIMTPTSRGLRETLKAEEIEFTLPLQSRRSSNEKPLPPNQRDGEETTSSPTSPESAKSPPCDDAGDTAPCATDARVGDEDEEELEQTDDGAASWLETLGLDKKHYRSLDPNKVKLQRDSFRVIDNRPESTVLVTGHNVQALFNFLLNCRSCVANTGVQGGIPPTILSPSPFKGATLKTLKVKQGTLRQQSAGEPSYSLEVIGPILPSTYTGLNHLFSITQADYTAVYGVHEQSTTLNVTAAPPSEDLAESSDHSRNSRLGKEAIRELNYTGDGFTWSKY